MIHISVCKKAKTAVILLEILGAKFIHLGSYAHWELAPLRHLAVKYENRKDNLYVKVTCACSGVARLFSTWSK
jgi:hypothetical protein